MKRNLNLGCGPWICHRWDWLNADSQPSVLPQILVDGCVLPFRDGAFERVMAAHLVEHMPLDRVPDLVASVGRVTRGEALIVAPDLPAWRQGHTEGRVSDTELEAAIHGGNRYPGDEHYWEPDRETMTALLPDWDEMPLPDAIEAWPLCSPGDTYQLCFRRDFA